VTIARDQLDPTLDTLDQVPDTSTRIAPAAWVTAAGLGILAIAAGLVLPDVTGDPGGMTHYMGLLAANQPWNLLLFMAVPVILAETLAITELVILYTQGAAPAWVHTLSRAAGLIAGPWFLAITTYLLTNAVVPLTAGAGWAGPADIIAVGAYLAGVVPLVAITLIELGILGRGGARARMRLHATFVGIFLVVAHVAMIFGMLDPTLLGWNPANSMHAGHGM
jgi:hypothetical protein